MFKVLFCHAISSLLLPWQPGKQIIFPYKPNDPVSDLFPKTLNQSSPKASCRVLHGCQLTTVVQIYGCLVDEPCTVNLFIFQQT